MISLLEEEELLKNENNRLEINSGKIKSYLKDNPVANQAEEYENQQC